MSHALQKLSGPTIITTTLKKLNISFNHSGIQITSLQRFVPEASTQTNPLQLDRPTPKLPKERPPASSLFASRDHSQKHELDVLQRIIQNMTNIIHPEKVNPPDLAAIRANGVHKDIEEPKLRLKFDYPNGSAMVIQSHESTHSTSGKGVRTSRKPLMFMNLATEVNYIRFDRKSCATIQNVRRLNNSIPASFGAKHCNQGFVYVDMDTKSLAEVFKAIHETLHISW
jgi:hypothetical protein